MGHADDDALQQLLRCQQLSPVTHVKRNAPSDCDNLFEYAQQAINETHLIIDLIAGTQNVFITDGAGRTLYW